MKYRTAELEGKALDYMVWLAERGEQPTCSVSEWAADYGGEFFPSTDWQQAGQIIERKRLQIGFMGAGHGWQGAANPKALADFNVSWYDGPTPLIAAMRAYVASVFGDEVEVPV